MRNLCIVSLMMILIILIFGYKLMYSDKDFCLDTGVCVQGLKVNTEYGLIIVNKENCIKYNWIWDNKSKTCRMK